MFKEKDLYTKFSLDHVPDDYKYEEFLRSFDKNFAYETETLGGIDAAAAPVIMKIIERSRRNQVPQLTMPRLSQR